MGWGEKAIEIRSVETGHLDGVFMHKRAQRLKFLCERNDKVGSPSRSENYCLNTMRTNQNKLFKPFLRLLGDVTTAIRDVFYTLPEQMSLIRAKRGRVCNSVAFAGITESGDACRCDTACTSAALRNIRSAQNMEL
ncbi:unnamed protein product [Menidia menidia]|uniref:(Atlantic silverside) hypothetical protein n=1 Tax=Menidia menidia TaxID=238744 RepID=A0A8S4AGT5_9TELE|nr:unnamed protein product [Menidia menidia]